MTTVSHGLWTYIFLYKHSKKWLFVIGAMAPDFLYFFSAVGLVILNPHYGVNFFTLPYPAILEALFLLPWVKFGNDFLHSIIVWFLVLPVVFFISKKSLAPLVIGWGIHQWQDILTHVEDADSIFWPLSNLQFRSFFSYWDPQYYGDTFKVFNAATLLILGILFIVLKKIK